MVDLVKIRKKAKKKEEDAKLSGAPAASPAEEGSESAGASKTTTEPAGAAAGAPQKSEDADAAQPRSPTPSQPSSKLDRFKEEAGKRREQIVETEVAATGEHLELLTFVIAGEHYSLDIERIVEIVTPRPVTKVPNADPFVVGIISLRGTIVTLLDARSRLRHPPAAGSEEDRRIIVIDQGGELAGFEVDRVLRVVKIDAAAVEPHPVVHASEKEEAIRGVFRHANALTILLDLDKLLGLGRLSSDLGLRGASVPVA